MSLGDLLLVFLALGVSAGLAWRAGRTWRVLLFASALLMVLAVAAELAQGLTATREMRVGDVVLNLMGCAVGIGVGAMLRAGGSGGVSSSATSRR